MSRVVLNIKNVSKQYRLGEVGLSTLSDDINQFIKKVKGKKKYNNMSSDSLENSGYVWALRDISLTVNKGEVIGIIGRNGAGKSTLLKLLSKVTAPTKGSISIKGRLSSLLEVGTGFHPELTGRENIFLNGAILGMSQKEIKLKIGQIIEFSGCSKYIDTPVKRYSSGMKVRLGFAVAAHLEPEILVVDEVLAVGDVEFQKKCIGKMKDVAGEGRTVLFVSHNMSSINNLCEKCMVLDKGEVFYVGDTTTAIKKYLELNENAQEFNFKNPILFNNNDKKDACLLKVGLRNNSDEYKLTYDYTDEITIEIKFKVNKFISDLYANFVVLDSIGNKVFMSTDQDLGEVKYGVGNEYSFDITLPKRILKPDSYSVNIGINSFENGRIDKYDSLFRFEIIDNSTYRSMKNMYRSSVIIAPELKWKSNE